MATPKFKDGDKVTVVDPKHPNAGEKCEVVAVLLTKDHPVRYDLKSLPGPLAGGKHEFGAEEKQIKTLD